MHPFLRPKPPTAKDSARADIAMQVAAHTLYKVLEDSGQVALVWPYTDPQGAVTVRARLSTAKAGEAPAALGELALAPDQVHALQQAVFVARRQMRASGTRSLALTTDHAVVRLTMTFDLA